MLILVRILAALITIIGVIILLKPEVLSKLFSFLISGKRVYIVGVLRLVFGIIFLLAASSCRYPIVIAVLGILMVVGGILVFTMGPGKIKAIFEWWNKKPPVIIRVLALFPICIGILILFSV